MKKTELKRLIKPLVKECIQEVLLEEGLLSNVVSEVVKGMRTETIIEREEPQPPQTDLGKIARDSRLKMDAHRSELMESIGKDAYNGVNLFENTDPISHKEPVKGHANLGNPNDAGVDISSFLGNSKAIWQALK